MDLVDGPQSAGLQTIAVVNIASPTELNAIAGTAVGEQRLAYQVVAADNLYTIYSWDSADSGGVNAPYVMAGSSGFWIACGGRYTNSDVSIRGVVSASSDADGTNTLGRALVGSMAGTDQATFSHFDFGNSTGYALQQNNTGSTFINTPTGGSIGFRINNSDQATMSAAGGFNLNLALTGTSAKFSALTSGRVTFAGTAGLLSDSANLTWSGTVLTVAAKLLDTDTTNATDSATAAIVTSGGLATAKDLWVGANASAGTSLSINGAAANSRFLRFMSANTLRWQLGATGTSHDFNLSAYDASGVLVDTPVTIVNAASGTMTVTRPIAATAGTAATSTSTGTIVVTGGVGISGSVYASTAVVGALTAGSGGTAFSFNPSQSAFFSSDNSGYIYTSNGSGGQFSPMTTFFSTAAGVLVVQPRSSAARGMLVAAGSTSPTARVAVYGGTQGVEVLGNAAVPSAGNDTALGSTFMVTGGTITTAIPNISATNTWNAGGVTFTGWKLNITDSASASGSLLLDLQVASSSKFSVDKSGAVVGASLKATGLTSGRVPFATTGGLLTDASNFTYSGTVLTLGVTSGTHVISSTTASTTTGTGALTIAGGLGVAGATNIGGQVQIAQVASDNYLGQGTGWYWSSDGTSAGTKRGGIFATSSSAVGIFAGSSPSAQLGINSAGDVTILSTTASTSTTTGAFVLSGGAGIGGRLNVAGQVQLTGSVNHYLIQNKAWVWSSDGTASGTQRALVYGDSSANLILSGGSGSITHATVASTGMWNPLFGQAWGLTKTTSSAGTTTLTSSSTMLQNVDGSTTHTITLPAANGASPSGLVYIITNYSSGTLTVQRGGTDQIITTTAVTSFTLTTNQAAIVISEATGFWKRLGPF